MPIACVALGVFWVWGLARPPQAVAVTHANGRVRWYLPHRLCLISTHGSSEFGMSWPWVHSCANIQFRHCHHDPLSEDLRKPWAACPKGMGPLKEIYLHSKTALEWARGRCTASAVHVVPVLCAHAWQGNAQPGPVRALGPAQPSARTLAYMAW